MRLEGAPPVGDGDAVVDRRQLFHFCKLGKEVTFIFKFIHSKSNTVAMVWVEGRVGKEMYVVWQINPNSNSQLPMKFSYNVK